jgi:hypothetical protein
LRPTPAGPSFSLSLSSFSPRTTVGRRPLSLPRSRVAAQDGPTPPSRRPRPPPSPLSFSASHWQVGPGGQGHPCWRKISTSRQAHSKPNKAGLTHVPNPKRASQFSLKLTKDEKQLDKKS